MKFTTIHKCSCLAIGLFPLGNNCMFRKKSFTLISKQYTKSCYTNPKNIYIYMGLFYLKFVPEALSKKHSPRQTQQKTY